MTFPNRVDDWTEDKIAWFQAFAANLEGEESICALPYYWKRVIHALRLAGYAPRDAAADLVQVRASAHFCRPLALTVEEFPK